MALKAMEPIHHNGMLQVQFSPGYERCLLRLPSYSGRSSRCCITSASYTRRVGSSRKEFVMPPLMVLSLSSLYLNADNIQKVECMFEYGLYSCGMQNRVLAIEAIG